MQPQTDVKWHLSQIDAFWNTIAIRQSVFNLYEQEEAFLNLLAGFVGTGINARECSIVIATEFHLKLLRQKLSLHGLYVDQLIKDEQYVPINAELALSQFLIDGLPNEALFMQNIGDVIDRAKKQCRPIRIFREMAPLLQSIGNKAGTTLLERFWHKLNRKEELLLFCAYPKAYLAFNECEAISQIGCSTKKVVRNTRSMANVLYAECSGN